MSALRPASSIQLFRSKTWTIGRRLGVGFGAIVVLVAILATFFTVTLRDIGFRVAGITKDNLPGVGLSSRILQNSLNLALIVREHIASDDSDRIKALDRDWEQREADIRKNFAEYEETIYEPEDREIASHVMPAFDAFVPLAKKVRELSSAGKDEEATALLNGEMGKNFAAFQAAVQAVADYNARASTRAAAEISATMARSNRWTLTIALSIAGLAVALGGMITVSVRRGVQRIAASLSDASTQVSAASSQVAGSSQSLAQGASEQAASLEETSASLTEINSMTKRNADNAQNAKALAQETRQAADHGTNQMNDMVAAMAAIKASSDNISKIIKTIDEIAFQTNILALNAAVEAARAGEAGMGFAVVAEEVRNLAQRSAHAAKETAERIDDSITKSGAGVEISGRVADSLKQIAEKTRRVDELVAEIAAASSEQNRGIDQVSAAVTQMDQVTQSTASNAEEAAAAAEELSAQARTMDESVAELATLVGGMQTARADTTRTIAVPVTGQRERRATARPAGRVASENGDADHSFFNDENGPILRNGARGSVALEFPPAPRSNGRASKAIAGTNGHTAS